MRRAILISGGFLVVLALGYFAGLWIGTEGKSLFVFHPVAVNSGTPASETPMVHKVPPLSVRAGRRMETADSDVQCSDEFVVQRFNFLWYGNPETWKMNRWLGIETLQNPLDAWITQEIMVETKPDFVIDCGSYLGGSAALWATFLAPINPSGRVISIDIVDRMQEARKIPIVREKVDFLVGSSTAPEIVQEVKRRVSGKRVLVILDSLHTKEHVLEELRNYGPMIRVGGYIIVQDTNLNGHPVGESAEPGPYEAVEAFLAGTDAFVSDRSRERFLVTFSPRGFLKRVKP